MSKSCWNHGSGLLVGFQKTVVGQCKLVAGKDKVKRSAILGKSI